MEKDKRYLRVKSKTLMICMIFRKFFCEVYGEDTIRLDCAINTDICFLFNRPLQLSKESLVVNCNVIGGK